MSYDLRDNGAKTALITSCLCKWITKPCNINNMGQTTIIISEKMSWENI